MQPPIRNHQRSLAIRLSHTGWTIVAYLAAALTLIFVSGCNSGHADYRVFQRNIALHSENAALKGQVQRQQAQIKAFQAQLAAKTPRVATLPPTRLAELFTVRKIHLQSQTTTARFHGGKKIRGFRVFVATVMAGGTALPATGKFTITAFDLARKNGSPKIGQWVFTARQSKKLWYGRFGLDCFAFDCPWKHAPKHAAITFHVRFREALTGRIFTAQRLLQVKLAKRYTAASL